MTFLERVRKVTKQDFNLQDSIPAYARNGKFEEIEHEMDNTDLDEVATEEPLFAQEIDDLEPSLDEMEARETEYNNLTLDEIELNNR